MKQLRKGSAAAKKRMAQLRAMRKPTTKRKTGTRVSFKAKGKSVSFLTKKKRR